jgi:hypothetical protein
MNMGDQEKEIVKLENQFRDYQCSTCREAGCVDSPSKMFDNDAPPVTVSANSKGWVTCAGCGKRFNTNYRGHLNGMAS